MCRWEKESIGCNNGITSFAKFVQECLRVLQVLQRLPGVLLGSKAFPLNKLFIPLSSLVISLSNYFLNFPLLMITDVVCDYVRKGCWGLSIVRIRLEGFKVGDGYNTVYLSRIGDLQFVRETADCPDNCEGTNVLLR